jgi:hypothetical protein
MTLQVNAVASRILLSPVATGWSTSLPGRHRRCQQSRAPDVAVQSLRIDRSPHLHTVIPTALAQLVGQCDYTRAANAREQPQHLDVEVGGHWTARLMPSSSAWVM